MKTFALRLRPKQELKRELVKFTKEKQISAGIVLTCVGSLKKAVLRLADESVKEYNDKFEIVSLVGTLSQDGVHLHISISDSQGKTIGGHLKEGIIYTTAEIIIGEIDGIKFSREQDEETGFRELAISK